MADILTANQIRCSPLGKLSPYSVLQDTFPPIILYPSDWGRTENISLQHPLNLIMLIFYSNMKALSPSCVVILHNNYFHLNAPSSLNEHSRDLLSHRPAIKSATFNSSDFNLRWTYAITFTPPPPFQAHSHVTVKKCVRQNYSKKLVPAIYCQVFFSSRG